MVGEPTNHEEPDEQEAAVLPAREAMSLITADTGGSGFPVETPDGAPAGREGDKTSSDEQSPNQDTPSS